MNRIVTIALITLLAGCAGGEDREVLRALHKGSTLHQAGRYAEAALAFAEGPVDARLSYDRGHALYRDSSYGEAVLAFGDAERLAVDSTLKPSALYNLGTARLMQAIQADSLVRSHARELEGIRIEGDDIAQKVSLYVLRDSLRRDIRRLQQLSDSSLKEGVEAFKNCLRLDPGQEDARHNLVAARQRIKAREDARSGDKSKNDGEKELGEKARLLMQQADALVDEYRFSEALQLLQSGLEQDPTLEQRRDYMDKLQTIERAAQVP